MTKHYLGWQWVSGRKSKFVEKSPAQSGYNIYAPVMYKVAGASLEVIKDFSSNIVLARQKGYGVWLTFQQFGTDPNLEENIISEIIIKALKYGADGINIDFEGMGEKKRDQFTSFISKLYRQTKRHNLVLSVDVVRPAASMYSLCYDRRKLAQVCDYLILMAYDQHWATSPQEGSVAELPWTEDSINKLLSNEGVPAEKLILAVPFYSRNWKIQGQTRRVSSTAMGLQSGLDILANYDEQNRTSSFGSTRMSNVEITYDGKSQQTLVTYNDTSGNLNKIWLEDYQSLAKRHRLAEKYRLAGLAAWSLEWMDDGQQAWRKLKT